MLEVTCPENVPETKSGNDLDDRVHLTQKEVRYVHQTAQHVAEFFLRRLMSNWVNNRGDGSAAAPVVPSSDQLGRLGILPIHQSLALHAASLQLNAFSGGELTHPDLQRPLWLGLMLEGKGLRRMTP